MIFDATKCYTKSCSTGCSVFVAKYRKKPTCRNISNCDLIVGKLRDLLWNGKRSAVPSKN